MTRNGMVLGVTGIVFGTICIVGTAAALPDTTRPARPELVKVDTDHEAMFCVTYGDDIDCDENGWLTIPPVEVQQ